MYEADLETVGGKLVRPKGNAVMGAFFQAVNRMSGQSPEKSSSQQIWVIYAVQFVFKAKIDTSS